MSLLCLSITNDVLAPCKNDLKCQTNILYFILTWLTSEFHSSVFVSVTAFEIFTGENIFDYLHHWSLIGPGWVCVKV